MRADPGKKQAAILKIVAYAIAAVLAVLTIALMVKFLPKPALIVLLDYRASSSWPYTVQNVMWVVFFVGLAEVVLRWRVSRLDEQQLSLAFLPEDDETVLKPGEDLIAIFQKVRSSHYRTECFLPRLIERCVLNFNISRSVDQTNSLLGSSLELFQHEIDLKYSMIRYIAWLIPTLGFLGTVYGIMLALTYAGDPQHAGSPDMLTQVTGYLGVAFNTTLLALLQAAVLVLLQSVVQGREEQTLNRSGQYCLDNLINRLYVP